MEYTFWGRTIFLGIWLFIPTIFDLLLGAYRCIRIIVIYIFKRGERKNEEESTLEFEPLVSVIIPVYNSEKTLRRCVESVINQTYSIDKIEIIMVDNGSKDNSYNIFQQIQSEYHHVKMWWYKSGCGKARALNAGIFYSNGTYIINIDSDGYISRNSIESIVKHFIYNKEISAITGSVIIDKDEIKETKGVINKLVQKCEFMEYLEVFFIGRNNQSSTNELFTMAGAISAIKREVAFKSQMYNADILGEDAHMTQQILLFQNGVVSYWKEAVFFTSPIEDFNRLSIQRSRWQRGALEVVSLFLDKEVTGSKKSLWKMMISDHTMTFPKLIWIMAVIYLGVIGLPVETIVLVNLIIYIAYSIISMLSILISAILLRDLKEVCKYTLKNILIFILMPLYRLILSFFRISGVIYSLGPESSWNAIGIVDEIKLGVKAVFSFGKRDKNS
ncbi:TIGR03111 family XrtG-associated glycosyltransferase [Clostridium paraputrificum]|uniref:TIGR03111 family XrtG-associated glycosyltransferase n=1 Tax=Clostridium paraputrificum TaxID=29363 RepID=UPI00325B0228